MPTVAVGIARLNKLAAFLDKLPKTHFNFSTVCELYKPNRTNLCGTVGCAMGWAPHVFPKVIGMIFDSDWLTSKQEKKERIEAARDAEQAHL